MMKIALIGASTLLGDEIKDELGRRRELWDELRLLTFDPETLGKVSDLGGDAALVLTADADSLDGVDLVIVVGDRAAGRDLEADLPGETPILVVAPDERIESAIPVVAGVNLIDGTLPPTAADARVLVSPQPATVALSLLLTPLIGLGLARADSVLLRPSSSRGQEGLDELLEQSRKILGFQSDVPTEVFERQLAYNVFPLPEPTLLDELSELLDGKVAVQLLSAQASVFHGSTLAVHLAFSDEVEAAAIEAALIDAPFVTRGGEAQLAPIDSAGQAEVQVGPIRTHANPDGSSGAWIWAVFDDLTRGGALNAVEIVEAFGAPKAS